MTAPATAPIGPSTMAPDKAPNAASPVRSCAIAAEDISDRENATVAIVFFIRVPPAFLRKQRPRLAIQADRFPPRPMERELCADVLVPTGLDFETAIGSRLRRVFPIQDHYFDSSRTWIAEIVVVKLLLGPRRRIAEPVVFYRCAQ
jgi:hypothetical protein